MHRKGTLIFKKKFAEKNKKKKTRAKRDKKG